MINKHLVGLLASVPEVHVGRTTKRKRLLSAVVCCGALIVASCGPSNDNIVYLTVQPDF